MRRDRTSFYFEFEVTSVTVFHVVSLMEQGQIRGDAFPLFQFRCRKVEIIRVLLTLIKIEELLSFFIEIEDIPLNI